MALIPSMLYRVALSDTFDPVGGTWTAEPDFHSVTLLEGLAPTIDQATLVWPFGNLVGVDGARAEPLDIEGKYVRIEFLETDGSTVTKTWYGYIADRAQTSFDLQQIPASDPPEYRWKYGDQTWIAYGLEWFLGRQTVAGPTSENADRQYRAIGYNVGVGDGRDLDTAKRGNMHATNDPPTFDFSDDAIEWDAWSIVRHLLANQCPRDHADNPAPADWVVAASAEPFLNWYHPTVQVEHMSLLTVLERVIDRNRGLIWWLQINALGEIELQVSSSAPSPVTLPDASELPEALAKALLYHDASMHADAPQITRDGARRYDRVRVRGARRTCTFTAIGPDTLPNALGHYDFPIDIHSRLVPAWDSSLASQYVEALAHDDGGGPVDPDYASYDDAEKAMRNDAYRRREEFAGVFTHFKVVFGQTNAEPLSPDINPETGSILGYHTEITRRSVRLMRNTQLIAGVSYADATAPVANRGADVGEEPRPPMLFCFLPRGTGNIPITFGQVSSTIPGLPATSSDAGWRFAELLTDYLETVFEVGDVHPPTTYTYRAPTNFEMRILEGDAGVWITPAGGQPPHRLDFQFATPAAYEPTRTPASFFYGDLAVTVTAEWDAFCEATYPLANLPEDVPLNELVIIIGERARFDWLAEGTVYDIDRNGVPLQVQTGGALRDDRALCEQIARLAVAWYGEERATVTWSGELGKSTAAWYAWKFLTIGKLITGVQYVEGGVMVDGDGVTLVDGNGIPLGVGEPLETVNASISQIHYDLSRGTIGISAGFAEIDFGQIA